MRTVALLLLLTICVVATIGWVCFSRHTEPGLQSILDLFIHLLLMLTITFSGFGAWFLAKACFLSWFAEVSDETVTLVEVDHQEHISKIPVGVGSIMSPPIVDYITVFRCKEHPNLQLKVEGHRQWQPGQRIQIRFWRRKNRLLSYRA